VPKFLPSIDLHASLSIYRFMQEGNVDIADPTVQQDTTYRPQNGTGEERAQGPAAPFAVMESVRSLFH
jgi:hypothetical protein